MTDAARAAPDTDWHVARLYEFAREMGASILVPRYSRYVVDLNRPPDDTSLYPGQNTTGLCPAVQFNGDPVYRGGQVPTPDEIVERVQRYWRAYHAALRDELARIRADAWSCGPVGRAFDQGQRPAVPVRRPPARFQPRHVDRATAALPTCSRGWRRCSRRNRSYDWVANGRFKGGYITRHYGNPAAGIDAVQLETSQRIYMDEATFDYDAGKARAAQAVIARLLEAALMR